LVSIRIWIKKDTKAQISEGQWGFLASFAFASSPSIALMKIPHFHIRYAINFADNWEIVVMIDDRPLIGFSYNPTSEVRQIHPPIFHDTVEHDVCSFCAKKQEFRRIALLGVQHQRRICSVGLVFP
jgi:hypothetical protein